MTDATFAHASRDHTPGGPPGLRRAIAHDRPPPCRTVRAAWAEIVPAAVRRQMRAPGHRALPPETGRAPAAPAA